MTALADIMTWLGGQAAPASGRAVKAALAGLHPRAVLEAALKAGVETGELLSAPGSKGARLYRLAGADGTDGGTVSQSVPDASQDNDEPSNQLSNTLTRRQLAELLSVHMQTVTGWEREGLPIAHVGRKGKPSLYDEASVRSWLAAREEMAQTSGVVDVARERARKDRAQALLAEQTYQTRSRDLLPRADVEKAWSTEVAAVRTKLLSWSTTIADRVFRAGTLNGIVGVEQEMREAVEDVLRELSNPERIPDELPDPSDDGEEAAA